MKLASSVCLAMLALCLPAKADAFTMTFDAYGNCSFDVGPCQAISGPSSSSWTFTLPSPAFSGVGFVLNPADNSAIAALEWYNSATENINECLPGGTLSACADTMIFEPLGGKKFAIKAGHTDVYANLDGSFAFTIGDNSYYGNVPLAVPGPVVGAGLPGLMALGMFGLNYYRRRRNNGGSPA